MKSRYEIAKNVFIDSIDVDDYIDLSTSVSAFKQLQHSIEKPLKMILLFGRPGTGKSILLNRIAEKLKNEREIHYFETPSTNEKEFFHKLFKALTKEALPANTDINFSSLVNYCKGLRGEREIVILLDEAQMYGAEMMEKIRLLSDTRSVKFIVSLHKTEDEDLIAKEHFQSRIWEVIELKNATLQDQIAYVHKKLLKKNLFEVANSIKEKEMKMIHTFTRGNFRECNKLFYTIFEICEYYDTHEPSKVQYDRLSKKIIEMAALKLGYIDV
ncbi:ATP-binding protein [Sulfurovum mangrovi]|uniref:ATP-binding protein n=1 Tax=Sulfurovum mangrovi TaxID=2893889 RepID=UPI001E4E2E67|nr:ATP-binding protein [Sulfurovum mangrovi]UFH58605.1 ATP-binding protein [Sulfurovum mangrovi]